MERQSMLIIKTPDGKLHGQRLTDEEAVDLCGRLLEIREGVEPAPRPSRKAGGRKGRPRRLITGAELDAMAAMRMDGLSYSAIGRRTGHGTQRVELSLREIGL